MSESETFDSFVRRQQAQAAGSHGLDYQEQKEQWLSYLDDLYAKVRSYLKSHLDKGSIRIETDAISLNEEGIGPYISSKLKIIIGPQQISLTPVGTLLIGSKGRVDVKGSAGRARLALVDKDVRDAQSLVKVTVNVLRPGQRLPKVDPVKIPRNIEWTWKIVSAPPSVAFIDLNRESFQAMIVEVSGG